MRTLYHFPLDPNCRIIRLMLGEKRLDFREAPPSMPVPDAPVMEIPTLEDVTGAQLPYMMVIAEYLDESYPEPPLIGRDIIERAETRRLTHYFAVDMGGRVTKPILFEKVQKPMARLGAPDSTAMRTAVQLSTKYLGAIEELYEHRNWIAGGLVQSRRHRSGGANFGVGLRGFDRVGSLPRAPALVRARQVTACDGSDPRRPHRWRSAASTLLQRGFLSGPRHNFERFTGKVGVFALVSGNNPL